MSSAGYILEGDGIFKLCPKGTKKKHKKNKRKLKMIKKSKNKNRK